MTKYKVCFTKQVILTSCSSTALAVGETTTPIIRTSVANNNESSLGPAPGYYPTPRAFGAHQNGGQDPSQEMQHINLASPPPPPIPANFRNAEFF